MVFEIIGSFAQRETDDKVRAYLNVSRAATGFTDDCFIFQRSVGAHQIQHAIGTALYRQMRN